MAHFRITTQDGTETAVVALRLRRDGDRLVFMTGSAESPRVVSSLPAREVASVLRRVTEPNGLQRWISQPVPDPDGPGRLT